MKPVQSIAIAFAAGCAFGAMFNVPLLWIAPLILGSASFWVLPVACEFPKHVPFFFFAGLILVTHSISVKPDWPQSDSKFDVKGIVTMVRESSQRRSVFEMQLVSSKPENLPQSNARCYTLQTPGLKPGDIVEFTGYTKTPSSPGNPGEFDFASYLMSKDVGVMLVSFETPRIVGFQASPGTYADMVRSAFDKTFQANLPDRYAALLDSMVFGRREIPDDISRNFTKTGTSHIVAASGFNISIVTVSAYFLLLWMTGNKKASLISTIAIAIAYALIAGFSPSVSRALLMAMLSIGAQLLNRRHATSSGLALAVIILLAINPLWIADPGFQLSFTSTLCLFVISPVMFRLEDGKPWFFKIISLALVSVSIQMLALPILAVNFHSVSLISPVANLIVIPISAILTPLGLLASILGVAIPPLGSLLCIISYPLLIVLDKSIELLATPPWALWSIGNMSALVWLPFYIAVGFGLAIITKSKALAIRNIKLAALVTIVMSAAIFGGAVAGFGNSGGTVTFLDVGHGDSIFIKSPSGITILIDGGGGAPYLLSGDTGARIVIPFLRFSGVNSLDYVIATHRDQDHIGGLTSVINEFPIGQLFDSGIESDTFEARDFELAIQRMRIKKTVPTPKQKLEIDPLTNITFLGPFNPIIHGQTKADTTNNNSVACLLEMDGVRILFGADIQSEAMILQVLSPELIKADIVKIPHHGGYSPGFSRWLEAVNPQLVVNSDRAEVGSGLDSRIEEAVISRNVPVVSTARMGAITITVNKGSWTVSNFADK